MPDPVSAIVAAGSTLVASQAQKSAAQSAAGAQQASAEAGIAEQRRQFDEIQKLLAPYSEAGAGAIGGLQPYAAAGAPALEQQQALLGLRGAGEQQAAISALESSPLFQSQVQKGEEALLQRASATGGLRGGNIQAALAQFRPQMLQQEIERQYGRLGGLTSLGQLTTQNIAQLGQAAAARTGAAGLSTAQNIAGLLGQQGAAQAGAELAAGRAQSSLLGLPAQYAGYVAGGGQPINFGSMFGSSGLPSSSELFGLQNQASTNVALGAAGL